VWLLEGEEETGSANLGAFLSEHRDRLQATGCIWESGSYGWDRAPTIYLGLKGMLSVELVAKGPARDLHSSMAAYVESPVWRLIWALASLKGPDGSVRIPGFYESVHVPTAAQAQAIASIPDDTARDLDSMGVRSFLGGMTGSDVYRANSFSPTANIQGIQAGYSGPGSKTILPKEARAKVDIRLVPDQDPAALFDSLRRYLNENGFSDVSVDRMEGEADLYPAASDPASPFVQKVIQACREVSGRAPVVLPSMGGSGPMAPFTAARPHGLGLPTAGFGVGNPDSRAHGPNENIRLSDMRDHMRSIARVLELLAEDGTAQERK
jgi:acetylornithine deacetylase/succinyl-diaminopimelate desuccinylase-like protein